LNQNAGASSESPRVHHSLPLGTSNLFPPPAAKQKELFLTRIIRSHMQQAVHFDTTETLPSESTARPYVCIKPF